MAEEREEGRAISPGDIAIFKFLAAVELVETDLWTQYTLLAEGNSGFQRALTNIDPALVRYNHDIRRDEASHARSSTPHSTMPAEIQLTWMSSVPCGCRKYKAQTRPDT